MLGNAEAFQPPISYGDNMKTYIKFDEKGKQIEVTTLEEKPKVKSKSDNWLEVPEKFDFGTRYKLLENGKIQEMSENELNLEKLEVQKDFSLQELGIQLDQKRSEFLGISDAKRKSHEIQEKAARDFLDNPESSYSAILEPLAKVRGVSISEIATSILEKANLANKKIIEIEAIEDDYQSKIKSTTNLDELGNILSALYSKLEVL